MQRLVYKTPLFLRNYDVGKCGVWLLCGALDTYIYIYTHVCNYRICKIYICIYIYVYIYIYIHIYIYTNIYRYTHSYMHICVCLRQTSICFMFYVALLLIKSIGFCHWLWHRQAWTAVGPGPSLVSSGIDSQWHNAKFEATNQKQLIVYNPNNMGESWYVLILNLSQKHDVAHFFKSIFMLPSCCFQGVKLKSSPDSSHQQSWM